MGLLTAGLAVVVGLGDAVRVLGTGGTQRVADDLLNGRGDMGRTPVLSHTASSG